jgi:excisionase family DNA binding protein
MDLPADLKTPKQLARRLDVHVSTVRRWMRRGALAAYKIGGRWRASEAAALALYVRAGPRRGAG